MEDAQAHGTDTMTKKGGRQRGALESSSPPPPDKPSPRTSPDQPSKATGAPLRVSVLTKRTRENANMKPPSRRPIKKAHVRFDDYLDLNEENMRRWCKRLMNSLYHEPASASGRAIADAPFSPLFTANANGATCRPISSPPVLEQSREHEQTTHHQSATSTTTMSTAEAESPNRITGNIISRRNDIASSMILESPPSNEKSYLRSQYERRQKRQIALMQQQQQQQQQHEQLTQEQAGGPTMAAKLNLTADARGCNQNDNNEMMAEQDESSGANNNICRQQPKSGPEQEQQDLAAKSHELSKRRFFEKLERRESMKNSAQLSTRDERQLQLSAGARAFKQVQHPQPPACEQQQQQQQQQRQQQMLPTKANMGEENLPPAGGDEEKSPIFQEPAKRRELIANGTATGRHSPSEASAQSDEQLMLKVYQSMVAAGSGQPARYRTPAAVSSQTAGEGGRIYEVAGRPQRLVSSSSSSSNDHTAEEDIGSSCSSSGFGASVSATSSGSASSDDRRSHQHKSFKEVDSNISTTQGGHYRQPSSSIAQSTQLYDTVVRNEVRTRRNESPPRDVVHDELHYKRVGPDQAYSDAKERPVLIENHGYSSLVARYRSSELPALPPPPARPARNLHMTSAGAAAAATTAAGETKAPAFDLYSTVLYANLPASLKMQRSPIVEYATVTAASRSGGGGAGGGGGAAAAAAAAAANIPPTENKRYSASRVADRHHHHQRPRQSSTEPAERTDDCASSLSGHNLSTSSANSGGFSMLPPVRLIDHNFANNSDLLKSLEPAPSVYGESGANHAAAAATSRQEHEQEQVQEPRKSHSLFKRFGSLVSRAFLTSTTLDTSCEVEVSCAGSGAATATATHMPRSSSTQTQSLSLRAITQTAPEQRKIAHDQRANSTTANPGEHKSGGGGGAVRNSCAKNHVSMEDNLNCDRVDATQAKQLARPAPGEKASGKASLAMAEADLVILPTKHSKDNQQRAKNDTYGLLAVKHSSSSARIIAAARDCPVARREDERLVLVARAKRSSRNVGERKAASQRRVPQVAPVSPRSTSISIASSYSSSSSLNCSSSLSEFCGPTSLIGQSHASSDMRLDLCARGRAKSRRFAAGSRLGREMGSAHDTRESSSVLYASLHQARSLQITSEPRQYGWRKLEDNEASTSSENEATAAAATAVAGALNERGRNNELVVNEGKCRSMNLYQNLLRHYKKRRHHHRHHNHHQHHQNRGGGGGQHHHHHNHHRHSTRHAHYSATARCAHQQSLPGGGGGAGARVCSSKNCTSLSERSSSNTKNSSNNSGSDKRTAAGDEAAVWGQLIKINKSDGSQVIELQRTPSRSWGFFVARGAINNMKGIFISRVHDNATGCSLTGLLGIGDRILAIDNCSIEPDDILRVNRMISEKNKILLRVKPFKG